MVDSSQIKSLMFGDRKFPVVSDNKVAFTGSATKDYGRIFLVARGVEYKMTCKNCGGHKLDVVDGKLMCIDCDHDDLTLKKEK